MNLGAENTANIANTMNIVNTANTENTMNIVNTANTENTMNIVNTASAENTINIVNTVFVFMFRAIDRRKSGMRYSILPLRYIFTTVYLRFLLVSFYHA